MRTFLAGSVATAAAPHELPMDAPAMPSSLLSATRPAGLSAAQQRDRDHLDRLEAEAMYVLRETAAQFERPVLLFSGGKDSIVMTHVARKAFWPARLPFPLLHVDTGHNFDETLEFRDRMVAELGAELIVASVQDSIDRGRVREEKGPGASRNALQTVTLLDALEAHKADAALGGGRRDEEKARAKERFFSHRDEFGQWEPKLQRPELWDIFNGRKHHGEHFRVFPLSNWTEMDVWQYVEREGIALPSLYFTHERPCIVRDGVILAHTPHLPLEPGERPEPMRVRFRTIGDATCTGAVLSEASSLPEVIAEVAAARHTERGTRADDRRSEAALEDRKRQGYF
jgi:sulfate adenylyltransferase subunit 2